MQANVLVASSRPSGWTSWFVLLLGPPKRMNQSLEVGFGYPSSETKGQARQRELRLGEHKHRTSLGRPLWLRSRQRRLMRPRTARKRLPGTNVPRTCMHA